MATGADDVDQNGIRKTQYGPRTPADYAARPKTRARAVPNAVLHSKRVSVKMTKTLLGVRL
jgi:hypothetical protein